MRNLFGVAGATDAGSADPGAGCRDADGTGAGRHDRAHRPGQGLCHHPATARATAKVYAVGKTITGGTKLHAVYADRVILDRGGKLEALLLPRKFTGGGLVATAPLPQADNPMLGSACRNSSRRTGGDHGDHPSAAGVLRTVSSAVTGCTRARNRSSSPLGLMPGTW